MRICITAHCIDASSAMTSSVSCRFNSSRFSISKVFNAEDRLNCSRFHPTPEVGELILSLVGYARGKLVLIGIRCAAETRATVP